ncbi:MAG: HipA domain-containing protein [Bacteroidales bacterium]|nr:HipA domain-containing protein [Bacteroidales bacterium]
MERCLYCYKELAEGEHDFHPSCAHKFFGIKNTPVLPYTRDNIDELAVQLVGTHTTVPGVQAKLSLHLNRGERNEPKKLTIVGLWGNYIMKPQSPTLPFLPENEDLTMHLAEIAGIKVVPHTLMRMADGEMCYLTRRIDRTDKGEKIPMEDACQLTERLTEHKYRSSYERVAKAISTYTQVGRLDLVNYWQVVLFSWIVGNSDMHLKNFSLYQPDSQPRQLTPAYDLLNVHLAMPEDTEELALTLNGKKKRLTKADFLEAMTASGLTTKVVDNLIGSFDTALPQWKEFIHRSFLPTTAQSQYIEQIETALRRLR